MVQEINRTQVDEEDILSDTAYYYDREKDELRLFWSGLLSGNKKDCRTDAAVFAMRLTGVEPAHLEPESSALSTELQTHL